ncbi:MAG: AI-2E family transporter [Acidobacteria bacterium]|nr:MAG: AI-2E family transporter [Acidobacteriota bacterium]RPJ57927.1 MAG: AI-2E family transporter [Acidobacteriota bacterium]
MALTYKYSQIFFGLVFLLILFVFFQMLRPFLVSIILALTLVSLFYPNYRQLRIKLKGRKGLASLLMCTVITILIIIPSFLFFLALFEELNTAYENVRQELDRQPGQQQEYQIENPVVRELWTQVNRYLGVDGRNLRVTFSRVVDRAIGYLLEHYSAILGGIGFFFFNFFIMIFSMFFFFRDGHVLLNEFKRLVPLAPEYEEMLIERLKEVIYATFFGLFATAACQGVAGGLIFFGLGLSNPVLWGTAIAVFSLVPMVGTAIVWVPVAVYLLLTGSVIKGIVLLCLGGVVIGLVDNLIRPFIIEGRSHGLHVLLVFFSLAGGLTLFGVPGLVLGPLVAAILVTFLQIYKIEFKDDLT